MASHELDPRPINTALRVVAHLSEDSFRVSPFDVQVETWEDGTFTATWPEAQAIGFGDTADEAFDKLLDDIVDLYMDISSSDPETLGPLPRKWLDIMAKTIVPLEATS